VSSQRSSPAPRKAPEKLAPGHRLPHEQVAENQRERLIAAMTDLAHERGYCETTVTDVLQRASVSRASFYQLFDNREHCALAAFDTHVARLQAEVISAYRNPDLDGPQKLRAALDHVFQVIISWPAAARLWSSEISTVGTAGLERREHAARSAANALAGALANIGAAPPSPVTVRAMTGATLYVIYTRVRDGRELELPSLTSSLLSWMVGYRTVAPSIPLHRDAASSITVSTAPAADACTEEQAAVRHRIITSVADLAATRGYQATSYRDIATAAQISLTTFYNNFANKQGAFLAAFDAVSDRVAGLVSRSFTGAPDPARGLRDAVITLYEEANSNQAAVRLACLQLPLTGRAGLRRLDSILHTAQRSLSTRLTPDSEHDLALELAIGAIAELLLSSAVTGRPDELPSLALELSYAVLSLLVDQAVAMEVATERA
jgi:AcrR family transcriptional regulator